MNPVFLPWMAEIGVVTYRTLKGVSFSVTFTGGKPAVKQISGPKRLPLPSELLSTFVIFGAYAVVAEGQGERRTIGSLLAWGTVLATVLMLAQHGTPASNAQSGSSSTNIVNPKSPTGYSPILGKTLPPTGGQTIYVPGRGLQNPAPSPGWANYGG